VETRAPMNPFAPPTAPLGGVVTGAYQVVGGLVLAFTIAMSLQVLIELGAIGVDIFTIGHMRRAVGGERLSEDTLQAIDAGTGLSAVGQVLMAAIGAIVFSLFILRASRNAHGFGRMPLENSPGWAVGGFFVPIVNLYRPYQAVREIWRASAPPAQTGELTTAPLPALLPWWWAAWIGHNVLGQAAYRVAREPKNAQDFLVRAWLDLSSSAVTIGAAILATLVVQALARRQAAAHVPR
jgi:hypothetical protein